MNTETSENKPGTGAVVPVVWELRQGMKVLTQAELKAMQARWSEVLKGRGQDPLLQTVLEMLGWRINQATAAVQDERAHHAGGGGPGLVSYRAGAAGALNDFVLDLMRATAGNEAGS